MLLGQSKGGKSLAKLFPKTRKDLVDIMESLLEFNPYFRPTAKELLKHPIFDEIRVKDI